MALIDLAISNALGQARLSLKEAEEIGSKDTIELLDLGLSLEEIQIAQVAADEAIRTIESKKSIVQEKKEILKKIIEEELENFYKDPDSFDFDKIKNRQINENSEESSMIKNQLFSIAKNVVSMYEKINDDDDIPEWIQKYIIQAELMMDNSADYLVHQALIQKI